MPGTTISGVNGSPNISSSLKTPAELAHAVADNSPDGDGHGSAGGHGHGTKAIIAALVANLGIAIAKFIGFLLTGSASLLAEAGHSVADTTNQALLLLGGKQAKKAETDTHQFGYGMTRYFWSFVVALILFSLGSLFAFYEGFKKLAHPEELESPMIAIGILGVAIFLESLSFRTAIKESRPLKGSQTWWRFIRTAKVPELPVLLLEDAGALIGLILALSATLLTWATDNPVWDAYGTIGIAALLAVIAVILIVEMKSLLLGESASPESYARISDTIRANASVRRLIHIRTMHIGPEDLLVATKVELDREMDFQGVALAIDSIEDQIRAVEPSARVIYIEPAIYDPTRA
jgi:cation diffusion facilitator family transporter